MEEREPVARLPQGTEHDDARWLALLIRQGLKLIVCGIEARYGLDKKQDQRAA